LKQPAKKRAKATPKKAQGVVDARNENVELAGAFAERLDQIRTSTATLVVATGRGGDGRDVLVPLMDWQVFGTKLVELDKPGEADAEAPDESGLRMHSSLLLFENLAFLMQDLGYDMREAVRILALQAKGGIAPPESRMRYTAGMLRLACEYMTVAADQIEAELAGPIATQEA
jgi:hypothetical protein